MNAAMAALGSRADAARSRASACSAIVSTCHRRDKQVLSEDYMACAAIDRQACGMTFVCGMGLQHNRRRRCCTYMQERGSQLTTQSQAQIVAIFFMGSTTWFGTAVHDQWMAHRCHG